MNASEIPQDVWEEAQYDRGIRVDLGGTRHDSSTHRSKESLFPSSGEPPMKRAVRLLDECGAPTVFDLPIAIARFSIPVPQLTSARTAFLRAVLVLLIAIPTSTSADDSAVLVPQLTLTDLRPRAAIFHPTNNDIVLIVNDNGRIDILRIGDWENPIKELEIMAGARTAALSPTDDVIVSGGADGTVRLWNMRDGSAQGVVGHHAGEVVTVAFSPTGKYIASRAADHEVRLWNTKERRMVGEPIKGGKNVAGVLFEIDGIRMVSDDNDVTEYPREQEDANVIELENETEARWGLAYSSSVACAYGGRSAVSAAKNRLRLLDFDNGTIKDAVFAPEYKMTRVAFHPDAARFVSGDSEGRLHLWNTAHVTRVGAPFGGHTGPISSVAFSPDGTRIISASADNSLRLWHVEGWLAYRYTVASPAIHSTTRL